MAHSPLQTSSPPLRWSPWPPWTTWHSSRLLHPSSCSSNNRVSEDTPTLCLATTRTPTPPNMPTSQAMQRCGEAHLPLLQNGTKAPNWPVTGRGQRPWMEPKELFWLIRSHCSCREEIISVCLDLSVSLLILNHTPLDSEQVARRLSYS